MNEIATIAAANQQRARKIIESTELVDIWNSVGAEVHSVGSLPTGLMRKHPGSMRTHAEFEVWLVTNPANKIIEWNA